MQWSDVAAAVLIPSAEPPQAPTLPDSAARQLRDAIEPIATIGWWSEAAGQEFDRLGLDFFGGYVWGRAASLGQDAGTATVVSAFGVFDASLLESVLQAAKPIATHAQILASRERGAAAGLAAATPAIDPERVASAADRLRRSMDGVDGAARPLFSGLRSLEIPTDPHGALWRAAEMYREHRGDGHLAACITAGLDQVEMNVLTELWLDYRCAEYSSSRGFGINRVEVALDSLRSRGWVDSDRLLTPDGRAARAEIEHATDRSQDQILAGLADDNDDLVAELSAIGSEVLAHHAAPADPRKRAAG